LPHFRFLKKDFLSIYTVIYLISIFWFLLFLVLIWHRDPHINLDILFALCINSIWHFLLYLKNNRIPPIVIISTSFFFFLIKNFTASRSCKSLLHVSVYREQAQARCYIANLLSVWNISSSSSSFSASPQKPDPFHYNFVTSLFFFLTWSANLTSMCIQHLSYHTPAWSCYNQTSVL